MRDDNQGIEKEMELEDKAKGIQREPTDSQGGGVVANIILTLILVCFMGGIIYLMFTYVAT